MAEVDRLTTLYNFSVEMSNAGKDVKEKVSISSHFDDDNNILIIYSKLTIVILTL